MPKAGSPSDPGLARATFGKAARASATGIASTRSARHRPQSPARSARRRPYLGRVKSHTPAHDGRTTRCEANPVDSSWGALLRGRAAVPNELRLRARARPARDLAHAASHQIENLETPRFPRRGPDHEPRISGIRV